MKMTVINCDKRTILYICKRWFKLISYFIKYTYLYYIHYTFMCTWVRDSRHFNLLHTILLFQLTGTMQLSVAGSLGHSTLQMDLLWATYSIRNSELDSKNLRPSRWAKTTMMTMTTIWTWGLNNWNMNIIIISC